MKRAKSLIGKLRKKRYIPIAIMFLIIIGLTIYIFVDKQSNSNAMTYSQVKINNNLGDSTACKSNSIRSDNTDITIKFCGNSQVLVIDNSNTSAETTEVTATESETSETSTCTGNSVNEETLKVENVVDFYTSYNYIEDSYIYYILTDDGKLYSTNEENIVNKDYNVTVFEELENIIDIDEYVTYENNTNIYTSDVYAVDENGELHHLRNIY